MHRRKEQTADLFPDTGRAPVGRVAHNPRTKRHGPTAPHKRHLSNLEGALPLLLIGCALLVYAAIIANQELASKGGHLPLWGLVGGVGAVIVGSGIYSTFLDPGGPSVPNSTKDWVTVPKAEWDALRLGRRTVDRSESPPRDPPWLERPTDRTIEPHTPPTVPTPLRASTEHIPIRLTRAIPAPPPIPPVLRRSNQTAARPFIGPTGPTPIVPNLSRWAPSSRSSESLKGLNEALTELETLVHNDFRMPPRRVKGARPAGPPSCADCDRDMSIDPAPNSCTDCGRGLCVDCAVSSQFEDGDLRCIECRVRRE